LDHKESGDSQIVEREPVDGEKPIEDKHREAQDRVHI